jgi:serine/threonine protein phosphatase PrpC
VSETPCPECGQPVADGDQFCEACGARLAGGVPEPVSEPEPVATGVAARCTCGGEIDADGFCTVCGLRAPKERDHFTEQPTPDLAMVCDKGIVHARNEDAAAIAAPGARRVIVVCDGVTSAIDSDIASLAAARAARDLLVAAPDASSTSTASVVEHWSQVLVDATAAAQQAAILPDAPLAKGENPPSTTFVAAVIDGPVLVAAWIGDSRCYWLPDDGIPLQVSTDDSWATEQIAHGTPREVAEADSRAHAITRWLGVDSPGGAPSTASVALQGPGWVLVCSDGLWNYCSSAADVRALVGDRVADVGADPLAVAGALCEWANQQGGHDNITAALARLGDPTRPNPTTSRST